MKSMAGQPIIVAVQVRKVGMAGLKDGCGVWRGRDGGGRLQCDIWQDHASAKS